VENFHGVLTRQSIRDVEIFALSDNRDFMFYYILFIDNKFACGYIHDIRADLVKAKLAFFSTARNIPIKLQ